MPDIYGINFVADELKNSLEHYGRLGMKWYQHIFGDYDPRATYNTNVQRAFARDGRGGLVKGLKGFDDAKNYVKWYISSAKTLNELSNSAQAKRGQQWIEDYLKQIDKERKLN